MSQRQLHFFEEVAVWKRAEVKARYFRNYPGKTGAFLK